MIIKEDAFWMAHIMSGNPPNLGDFIAQKLVKGVELCRSVEDKRGGLPFGKLVSYLIEKIHGTILISEIQEAARGMAMLDVAGFGMMDFLQNAQTGLWEKKGEARAQNED